MRQPIVLNGKIQNREIYGMGFELTKKEAFALSIFGFCAVPVGIFTSVSKPYVNCDDVFVVLCNDYYANKGEDPLIMRARVVAKQTITSSWRDELAILQKIA